MNLQLPDDILHRAEVTAAEVRLALAIQLYADHRIDHRDACQLAETVPGVLNRELTRRHISVQTFPPLVAWRTRQAG